MLVVEKIFHASPLQKAIARSLANHRPKVFIKFPVSELANHHESSEPIGSLICMLGNRSYAGKWGIKMCLQNLDTQELRPSQVYIRTPDLTCPHPARFPDSPFPWRRNPAASAGGCDTAPGRSLILFGKSWGSPRKVPGLQPGTARASTRCMHCWLTLPVPPVTGWAGNSSATVAIPAAAAQAGKRGSIGAALPLLLLPYMAGKGKNTENHKGCLAFPMVRLCLNLFITFPALTIQSAIFQALCLLKVLEKVSQQFNCFWKENN